MAEISKLSGVAIADVAKVDAVTKANIANINLLTLPGGFLLDTYTGSIAAYSVRRLNSQYTGACMRVREVANNTELDIGFDSNGYVDTAAIVAHCGNGTQLGYVTKWYDQSQAGGTGSGNDAEMPTSTQQPRIHGSGIDQDNGVAALRFNNNTSGTGKIGLNLQSNIRETLGASSIFCVFNLDQTFTSGFQNVWSIYRTQRFVVGRTSDPSYADLAISDADTGASNDYKPFTGTNRTSQKVRSIIYDGSSTTSLGKPDIDFAENGTLRAEGSVTYAGFNQPGAGINSLMYRENNTTQGARGYMQEWMVWDADQSTNQAAIEGNVNAFFKTGNFGTPTSGLLATYTGAVAAYSVRQLANTAVLAMRIREDGGDTETNIGFDANGDLDTAAISAHCGSNNGYVVTWFDQSGKEMNATQATTSSQPQIYNGTAVLTDNGKPCVKFVRTGSVTGTSLLTPSGSWSTSGALQFFMVFNNESGTGNQETWSAVATRMFTGTGLYMVNSAAGNLFYTSSKVANQNLFVYEHNSTARTVYIDGAQDVTSASPANASTSSSVGALGRRYNINEGHADVLWQELVHYPTNQSSNRTGIETNINNYFSIY